jgi:hypothetical protein
MIEKTLHLPFMIQVKTDEDSTAHYMIDGNKLKKSKTCILLEETVLWKKSSDGKYTHSIAYDKSEKKRVFVVIQFNEHHRPFVKYHNYNARFFDNFEDAMRYYSYFSLKETNGDAHD